MHTQSQICDFKKAPQQCALLQLQGSTSGGAVVRGCALQHRTPTGALQHRTPTGALQHRTPIQEIKYTRVCRTVFSQGNMFTHMQGNIFTPRGIYSHPYGDCLSSQSCPHSRPFERKYFLCSGLPRVDSALHQGG
eukprot:Lankesteria_metandrocarpae@DN3410_c0_g1_i1.p1